VRLPILYQDEHYVAIDKPPGLLVHRSPISRDRVFALQLLRDQLGRRVYPLHRLDRAPSGVMLFALSNAAAAGVGRQFDCGSVDKEYLAVVRGWVDDHGLVDHPLADEDGSGVAQPAQTRFRCLGRVELPHAVDRYPTARYSLVGVTPLTGRRQQIRRHFKHVSHPLVGDPTHGNGRHNRFFREVLQIRRMLLLARSLAFDHPNLNARLRVQAPLDPEWQRLVRLFGIEPDAVGAASDPGS
jgi:tRNA pseudouridine65 synthase